MKRLKPKYINEINVYIYIYIYIYIYKQRPHAREHEVPPSGALL